jgi:hypothetical protein
VFLLVLRRHRKLDVPGHLLKASGVSVVDFSVLHIGPPVVSARKASGIRVFWREGRWDAGTSVVATSQLVVGD